MTFIHHIYLKGFLIIYPFIHNHVTSYLMFASILSFMIWFLWKRFRKSSSSKKSKYGIVAFSSFVAIELFLIFYLCWFLFIHFQTVAFINI